MAPKTYFNLSVGLALGGTLFAGYLSGIKLMTKGCAFDEPCPFFLGYPACYYGFVIFAALLALSLLGRAGRMHERKAASWILAVAALGTIFSGSFVVQEVAGWFSAGRVSLYGFGLPTCVYGLVFYVALLVLSATYLRKKP